MSARIESALRHCLFIILLVFFSFYYYDVIIIATVVMSFLLTFYQTPKLYNRERK
jgi:hypothetical protein